MKKSKYKITFGVTVESDADEKEIMDVVNESVPRRLVKWRTVGGVNTSVHFDPGFEPVIEVQNET